ncbi:YnbD [Picochlorum sp. SENEW3]|nr:YnbD [Picochlorum sp. SENEW3]
MMLFGLLRLLRRGFRKVFPGLKLSGLVAVISTGCAVVQVFLVKPYIVPVVRRLPYIGWMGSGIEIWGYQTCAVGYIVSLCSTCVMAPYTTWMLGKRTRDGSIDPVRWILTMPYHVLLQLKLYIERLSGEENQYDMIMDGLYLGSWPAHVGLLPTDDDIKLGVIDVTCELPCRVREVCDGYHLIPVWDTHSPTPEMIQQAVEWAMDFMGRMDDNSVRRKNDTRRLFVHCAHGHGRSATVLGAILIALNEEDSAESVVKLMKRGRPRVRLNSRQLAGLQAWIDQYHSLKRNT